MSPERAPEHANPAECERLLKTVRGMPTHNERARKEVFVTYLPRILAGESARHIVDSFAAGAEGYLVAEGDDGRRARGFADTHHGQLLVEFKAQLTPAAIETAKEEVRRYISVLWSRQGFDAAFCCIATDVLRWHVWQPVPTGLSAAGVVDPDSVELELVEEYDFTEPRPGEGEVLAGLIQRVMVDEQLLQLSADEVNRLFGPESGMFELVEPVLAKAIGEVAATKPGRLALDLWSVYFSYKGPELNQAGLSLYVRQVYVVLLARLLTGAVLMTGEPLPITDSRLVALIDGTYFRQVWRVENLVDDDLFAWMTREPWRSSLLGVARQIFHALTSYDLQLTRAENALRVMYDELMPPQYREVFGQRSTPPALARRVLAQLFGADTGDAKYLDPACGSGTFLQEAILLKREVLASQGRDSASIVESVQATVYGIDVDPIAVALSRAAWTLAVQDLLPDAIDSIYIPVYQADSLFSLKPGGPTRAVVKFDDDSASIETPDILIAEQSLFDRLLSWAAARARRAVLDHEQLPVCADDALPYVSDQFAACSLDASPEDERLAATWAADLTTELAIRIAGERDSVWAFILRNKYRPSFLRGMFDMVATNPPWLAMSSIANVEYRDRLRAIAERLGIEPVGASAHHIELSTSFALRVIEHYMSDGARCAFVLPRSVFNADNHDPFRRRDFAPRVPLRFEQVWDLRDVSPLFGIPSFALFGTKDEASGHDVKPNYSLPSLRMSSLDDAGDSGELHVAFRGDKTAWSYEAEVGVSLTGTTYAQQFVQGADLMPRTAVFVDAVPLGPNKQRVSTSEREIHNKNNKVLAGRRFDGVVANSLIYATLTSSMLLPYAISGYPAEVVLPLESAGQGYRLISQAELLNKGMVDSARWFESVDQAIKESAPGGAPLRDRLDMRGKLTRQSTRAGGFAVHLGAGGGVPCAAYHEPGRDNTLNFVADQTTYVYWTEDELEALYLVGMLNSRSVERRIKEFQAAGLFGARHVHTLPLAVVPKYVGTTSQVRVAAQARLAADAAMEYVMASDSPSASLALRRRRVKAATDSVAGVIEAIADSILDGHE